MSIVCMCVKFVLFGKQICQQNIKGKIRPRDQVCRVLKWRHSPQIVFDVTVYRKEWPEGKFFSLLPDFLNSDMN